jgi:outer membrane protein TolC
MRAREWWRPVSIAFVVSLVGLPGIGSAQEYREPVAYSIDRAVSIALRNNRDLRVAELDLATAEKQVGEAYGGLFPEIDATASYTRNLSVPEAFLPAVIFDPTASPDDLIPVRFGADNQWQAGITVDQPLFDATVFLGVSTAGKFRDYNRELLRGAAQQVATNVRIAFLNVLLANERVRVTENSVARVTQTLEESRALNRAGLLGDYDVLRLEVELANVEPELRRSRDALAEARRTLGIQMGLPELTEVGAEGELSAISTLDPASNSESNRALLDFVGVGSDAMTDRESLVAMASASRSEVRQLALRKELEEVRVKVDRTDLFPTIDAFFNYSLTAQENGSLSFFGENEMQRTSAAAVGLRVTMPLFSGRRRWNRIAQRQISVRQFENQLAEARLRAANDVRTRADQVAESSSRAEAQGAAVGEATRGFEIASALYREGTGSRLEVIDAELALRQSELNYAQAVYDYLVARSRLDLAVGEVPVVDDALASMLERPGGDHAVLSLETNQ